MKTFRKFLYWTFKILAISLLIIPVILVIPGFIFHVISEELDRDEFINN
jgi:hypothetical protein